MAISLAVLGHQDDRHAAEGFDAKGPNPCALLLAAETFSLTTMIPNVTPYSSITAPWNCIHATSSVESALPEISMRFGCDTGSASSKDPCRRAEFGASIRQGSRPGVGLVPKPTKESTGRDVRSSTR